MTIIGGNDAVGRLSTEQKRQLLQRVLREKHTALEGPHLEPRTPGSVFPLSIAQQRLWFLNELDPHSGKYNLSVGLSLQGKLDVPVLEQALTKVVKRHEILRTTFHSQHGAPVQVIASPEVIVVPVADLRAVQEPQQGAEVRRLWHADTLRPFDLTTGPLLRTRLLWLDNQEWVLLITAHQIVSDHWSMGLLVREVSQCYESLRGGESMRLPELPVQYADYAVWQRDRLRGEILEEHLAFWRDYLAGAPPLLNLPTDRPRLQEAGGRAGTHARLLPEMTSALHAVSAREGTTSFMVLLAAWQVLLARYADTDDVSLGTPVAGRTRPEIEGLIGLFANTLVMRTDLSDRPTFVELLRRVRDTTLSVFAHQDLPFERVVEEVGPEQSLANTPLFQAMFSLETTEPGELRFGALRARRDEQLDNVVTRFDLDLRVTASGDDRQTAALTYRAELFDDATAGRMLEHFAALLATVVADPERPVAEVNFLSDGERRQLLDEWNTTASPSLGGWYLHERFAEQAARVPDALAVESPEGTLTYRELEARANRLAAQLRAWGVGVDDRVGLLVRRSQDLVVGVLGILKAGAAYLPLDPAYPAERLAFMFTDAGASVLVTHGALAERLGAFDGPVVRTDRLDSPEATEEAGGRTAGVAVTDRNLAYVIYTSGSTGTPRGVLVEHGGLSNYLAWFDREVMGTEGFALPLVSSLAFDAHVRQLFPPLLRGEPVWVLPEETVTDPSALLDALAMRERVSFGGVPTLWAALVDALDAGAAPRPRGLVAVLLGGEALPRELVERTLSLFPDVQIWNHYGPTEATVNATAARVQSPGDVSIGRPIANVRVYVLDAEGDPVPVGVPGELCVGGAGVARGYAGRPELTAARFVPDPFSRTAGARMYRTGDRARYRSDGMLEYFGRLDQQVKIRGFRIEPGEVEAALRAHAGVRDAVVAVGDHRLVAYIVPDRGVEIPGAELRALLAEQLPDYMVPGAFVVLDALPLTPSGKVDRRALPAPSGFEVGDEYVAPRTPTQEILAGIWAETLGVERVGMHDDFFELGGHSLLGIRVVSRTRTVLGAEISLRTLFATPTLEGFAEQVDRLRQGDVPAWRPPLVPVPRGRPIPLSFVQERFLFVDRLHPGNPANHLPITLRLRGALDRTSLRRSLAEVVHRHETLRTHFKLADGWPVQVVGEPWMAELPTMDLGNLQPELREAAVRDLMEAETSRSFDLERGPPLRAVLLRLADEEWVLHLVLHRIVCDGWSVGVLLREVSELYAALAEGRRPRLPGLPVQYADFAVWQREWLQGEVGDRHIAWWRERLADAPPLLELPTDRQRPPVQDGRGGSVAFELGAETARTLEALSRRSGATLFMTLLAGWQLLLSRYSGQEDVSVGTSIGGRVHPEAEGLIAPFANQLVLRVDLAGQPSFYQLLGRVREAALGAYEHQELPFERLVAELAVERSLSQTPLFQAMFSLGADAPDALRLGELDMQPIARSGSVVEFDLALAMAQSDDRLNGSLSYRAELWDTPTMERMAEHFATLLGAVAADPEQNALEVPFLSGAERTELLQGWSQSPPVQVASTLHERFAMQAAHTPSAVAVAAGDEELTYAELDRRASQLASRLQRLGVSLGSRVGLCCGDTPDRIVALLAILQAGGVYVPLDPAYPRERLAYLAMDAGIRIAVADEESAGALSSFPGEVLLLGKRDIDDEAARADAPVGPHNAAYVVYTSGSTGLPNGVVVDHGVITAHTEVLGRWLGLSPDDRMLHFAAPGSDASIEQLFLALLSGARVVLRGPEPWSAAKWASRANQLGVTVASLPSPYWREVVAEGAGSILPGLRILLVGGDEMSPTTVERWRAVLESPAVLVNAYGRAEVVATATLFGLHGYDPHAAETVPIGAPLPGRAVYVLDHFGEPVPVGVVGELYMGGPLLARGYFGRPEFTAERWHPDPFSGEPGARMYRTGDRVRWLPGGVLEFRGRTDAQVKIRGFRIEPGEVEAALSAHPHVREAVVVAREDAPGDRRLVGYVAAGPEGGVDLGELRRHLRTQLPEHMIPAAFVVLDAFPRTTAGMLDRQALPAPKALEEPSGKVFVAPRDPVEAQIAEIWKEVLRVERVGARDDFFELGGHSLLLVGLQARIRDRMGVEVPLVGLFEDPTVAGMAGMVELHLPESGEREQPAETYRVQRVLKGYGLTDWTFDVTIEIGLDVGSVAYVDGAYPLTVRISRSRRDDQEETHGPAGDLQLVEVLVTSNEYVELATHMHRTLRIGAADHSAHRADYVLRPATAGEGEVRIHFYVDQRWAGTQAIALACLSPTLLVPALV